MNCYENQGSRRCSAKRISSFIATFALIAVLLVQPIFAYSYDKNYLDYSSWDESNINAVAIDCEGAMGELSGSLNYFTEESSAYFLFNLNESEINEKSTISVIFNVSAVQASYDFTVDDSGVDYSDETSKKYFDIVSKTEEYTTGHAIMTVIMDIKDKITLHDFTMKVAVDGRLYNLFNSEALTLETYLPTTVKATTTKAAKQSTTKKSSKTTTKKSTAKKASTKASTKKQITEHNELQSDEGSADFSGNYSDEDANYLENSHFSPKAKAVLTGGLVIIGVGVLLFATAEIASALEKKKSESKDKSEDEKIIDDV